jgi:hypothetical protein
MDRAPEPFARTGSADALATADYAQSVIEHLQPVFGYPEPAGAAGLVLASLPQPPRPGID